MNRKSSAGQRPATSQPAMPQSAPRARSLRQIATCPFCAWQDRKIHVDTAAMVAAHARHPDGLHILLHEHRDQRLIVFGDDAQSQPCPHLVLAWGTCEWHDGDGSNGESPWCVEFDLDHPVVVAQPNCHLEVFLKERVVPRVCGRRFMPLTPVCCRKVRKKWHEPASGKSPARDFHVTASIYFAVDPVRLFEELAIKHAAFQQHRTLAEVTCKP
jgi:hypothetical protein